MNNAPYRPRLSFYHANEKGTGSACSFDLVPADGENEGCIILRITYQLTVGDRSTNTFPRFDWDECVSVKLGFHTLCRMLQVFRGETEDMSIVNLVTKVDETPTRMRLRHMIDPVSGYMLEVVVNDTDKRIFMFSNSESLGLLAAIEGSMGLIAFGYPKWND